MGTLKELQSKIEALRRESRAALERASDLEACEQVRVKFLGRKGKITTLFDELKHLADGERPQAGRLLNELKRQVEKELEGRKAQLAARLVEQKLKEERIDVTLPGRPRPLGRLHIITRTLRQIYAIFQQMGFEVYQSREVETDEYNFQLLNIPPGHPARDMWSTFYTTRPGVILRTHTSPGQIRVMRERCPEPIRVILPGKCYRYEQTDASHEWMFYQVEGLAVGTNITMGDLKGVLTAFVRQMFGPKRKVQFRCSYFPFTEPSMEVAMDCLSCGGRGCAVCKQTGWLEILGAGMVHPVVLENGGYDSQKYTGFAFGLGPERIAMLKHGVDDIRLFYANDLRFLEQF